MNDFQAKTYAVDLVGTDKATRRTLLTPWRILHRSIEAVLRDATKRAVLVGHSMVHRSAQFYRLFRKRQLV